VGYFFLVLLGKAVACASAGVASGCNSVRFRPEFLYHLSHIVKSSYCKLLSSCVVRSVHIQVVMAGLVHSKAYGIEWLNQKNLSVA
jgi:hypothetical protein